MPIKVKTENPQIPPFEECCFCKRPTPNWTDLYGRSPGEQVACCRRCAACHDADEVPTKVEWFRGE